MQNLKNDYVFFGGKRIARKDSSGNDFYYIEDHLGSSRAITTANGVLCSDADFLPYGQEVDYTTTCSQNYKFEGKERDTETGNDNFGARYYRSLVGRWLSPDWSAIPAAVPYADLTNPQTLNLYAMTRDNPETFADLDGHVGSGENGRSTGQSAQPTTTTCATQPSSGSNTSSCTTSKASNVNPAPTAQQQTDNKPVGSTTVGSLEKTMTHEDGSLSTPKGGDPAELVKAKTALANAIINGAESPRPPLVATPTVPASTQDAQIMRDAYTNRANGGADPVHGRMYYGTSHTPPNRLHSRRIGRGRQTVYEHFGPFNDSVGRGRQTYIYIYNDPGH